ncbi:MAG: bifunctional UDP-N-acetylglucosamine diphosphorylase/glucosamine-1-phosphate N-acetyltransferase GlmU, partial [Candidatus Muiribacteriaceae bacterium]
MDVLILAAGKGTRMKSRTPKVLFDIAGKPMLYWVIRCIKDLGEHNINVMLGHEYESVKRSVSSFFDDVNFFEQKEQLGTGHAVMEYVRQRKEKGERLLVLCGDTPLLLTEEIDRFIIKHGCYDNVMSVMSTVPENPFGYGRVIKDGINIRCIVEEKDCSDNQRKVEEVNTGIYIIENSFLEENINRLDTDNAQKEFYLTDLVRLAHDDEKGVRSVITSPEHIMGVNNIYDLSLARKTIRKRICMRHMLNGVDIHDPDTVFIDDSVKIESDVTIHPFVILRGDTLIRSGCEIHPFTNICDSVLDDVRVDNSHITGAEIAQGSTVGPYSRLREGTEIEKDCRVGNFVETKKSVLHNGVKASHLSYIGDSDIG